jgi:hypothetical protein
MMKAQSVFEKARAAMTDLLGEGHIMIPAGTPWFA